MKFAALFIALAVLSTGCHKPSTRLQPEIAFCENILLTLPLPEDVIVEKMTATFIDQGTALKLKYPEKSREYQVFYSVLYEYDSYAHRVESDRFDIHLEEQRLYNGGYSDAAEQLKKVKDENYATMMHEYNLTKEKAKEAVTILEKIQANE